MESAQVCSLLSFSIYLQQSEFWVGSEDELVADILPVFSSFLPPATEDEPDLDKKEWEAIVWWTVLFISLFQTLKLGQIVDHAPVLHNHHLM